MKIEQLGQTLREYLSQFSITRVLLPLAPILLYVFTGLRVLDNFFNLGMLVSTLVYVLFFAALLLAFANCRFRDIAIGSGIMGILNLINLIRFLIQYRTLYYDSLIYLLLYGLVAFLAYKKSLHFN